MEPPIPRRRILHGGHNEEIGLNGEGDSRAFLNPDDELELDLDDFDLEIEYFGLPADPNVQDDEIQLHFYCECTILFVLYMFYELMVFLVLLSTGFLTHAFFTGLSRIGIPLFGLFGYIGSFYCVLHMCLVFKLLHDYIEQKYFVPELSIHFRGIPSFKRAYAWINVFLVGICYWNVFTTFHKKCKLFTLGYEQYQINWTLFVLSLCYIYYFNVVRCIGGSERSKVFHQIAQNGMNILFGTKILHFGKLCGMYLLFEEVEIKPTTIVFVLITICLTLIYVGVQKFAYRNLNMGSGSKWAEILWSCIATDFLLKSYFGLNEYGDNDSRKIEFQAGVSYLMYITTKVVVVDFVKVHLGV